VGPSIDRHPISGINLARATVIIAERCRQGGIIYIRHSLFASDLAVTDDVSADSRSTEVDIESSCKSNRCNKFDQIKVDIKVDIQPLPSTCTNQRQHQPPDSRRKPCRRDPDRTRPHPGHRNSPSRGNARSSSSVPGSSVSLRLHGHQRYNVGRY
jgi:hypothetical protein